MPPEQTKELLPEVEKYFATVKKSAEQHDKTVEEISNSSKPFSSEARNKRSKAREAHLVRAEKAWEELQKSKNNLVAWIGNQRDIWLNYRSYGETILRALPADIDELDEISNMHGWCSTWEDFKKRALSDGAVRVEFEFEVKQNGNRWCYWYDIWLDTGTYFTKADAEALFKRGMQNLSFEAENQVYTIRAKSRTILTSS